MSSSTMATMRLLIHVAGQSDLLLKVRDQPDPDGRQTPTRMKKRRERVEALICAARKDADARLALRRLLNGPFGDSTKRPFGDEYESTDPPIPLLRALAAPGVAQARDNTPDLDVVVLGTCQKRPMDTLPVARMLVDAIGAGVASQEEANPVRKATAVAVHGFHEDDVVRALGDHLANAPRYQEALVTWGSGATMLTMGALTALSQANLRWRLVTTFPEWSEIVDPLEDLDVDPVIGVLVRWRMFAALDRLASHDPPRVQLTEAQRELIRAAADRHRAGLEAQDAPALRAVVADAVVRRDGTAGLAVRRYIPARYRELRATEPPTDQPTRDLLEYAEENCPRRPLGHQFRWLDERKEKGDAVVLAAAGLPSTSWLFHRRRGKEIEKPPYEPPLASVVDALQEIGKNSHTLCFPDPAYARILGKHLSCFDVDGYGWSNSGLPQPPLSPPDTVLAVWLAGSYDKPNSQSVGTQIASRAVPGAIRDYIDVEVRTQAAIFGVPDTPDEPGSLDRAGQDARLLSDAGFDAWVHSIDVKQPDPAAVEGEIEKHITSDTAALLLIPTGKKELLLALLHAMRRIGAKHGIPLFVRQNADPSPGDDYTAVYQWPALTGGDLPLLMAAQEALHSLELDVAWRLLAASAIDPTVTDQARRLAAAFACRDPMNPDQWPASDDSPPNLHGRTWGMAAQRMALVKNALARAATPADRTRLLVLAAGALEASIAASNPGQRSPGAEYRKFRDELRKRVRQHRGTREAENALVLLLLDEARNQAPITHGSAPDPDTAIADAIAFLTKKHSLTPADTATLPRDLATLLDRAVEAAPTLRLGRPDLPDGLIDLHRRIETQITKAINDRTATSDVR